MLVLSIAHFVSLQFIFRKWSKYAGFLFTGLSFVKMALSIVFLFPYLMPLTYQSKPFALNFIFVYFVFLIFDVVFITQELKKI